MRKLWPLLALASASCTLDRGEPGFDAQVMPDAAVRLDAGDIDAGLGTGSGAATMTGTWLQVHEASTCVLVDEQVTWASYLVDIVQDGRTLTESRRQCEVTLSPVFGLEVLVPDAARDAVEFVPVDRGYVSSLGESGTYTSATELSLWGVDLPQPLTDTVPTEPDDPNVVDGDDDGHPGLTFAVVGSSCERYIAQRSVVRYYGRFTAPNQIDGQSVTVTDANVIGSSQPLCGVSPRLTANDPHSRFRMVRVDGAGEAIDLDADGDGAISCAEAAPYFAAVLERRASSPQNCD